MDLLAFTAFYSIIIRFCCFDLYLEVLILKQELEQHTDFQKTCSVSIQLGIPCVTVTFSLWQAIGMENEK